jgi:RAB protein geranylgeranyltransferase component A
MLLTPKDDKEIWDCVILGTDLMSSIYACQIKLRNPDIDILQIERSEYYGSLHGCNAQVEGNYKRVRR